MNLKGRCKHAPHATSYSPRHKYNKKTNSNNNEWKNAEAL